MAPAPSVLRTEDTSYLITVNVGDYHLKAGSPAIDSAYSDAPNEPTLDIEGTARVDDPVVADTGAGTRTYDDRGAYEYYDKAPTNIALTPNTVAENKTGDTVIGALSTSDPDVEDTFTYSLVGGTGSTDNGTFSIVGSSLHTSTSFNYEAKSNYAIRVRSTDVWGLYVEKAITVTVTNVNEAPTDISLNSSTIAENMASNTVVGAFSTTDPDSSNSFTYSLVNGAGSTDNGSFNISGGNLRTTAIFNYENRNIYSIRVRSTDQGSLYFDKQFTITVTNINEAPTDIGLSASTIAENMAINTTVGTLTTSDPDAGNTFTYSLVNGIGSADNTSFHIDGSNLLTLASFNYEVKNSYAIRLRSTDQGGAYFEEAFTITVSNVNEAPIDIALSARTIAENRPANTVVGTLSTTDPDAGNTFTYRLVGGDGGMDNGSFNIVNNSLRTSAAFDYETKASYAIRVRSTDQGGLSFEEAFTISVTNVNETPTDITLTASTVIENQTGDTEVGVLSTIDPDGAGTFTYSLVGGAGSADNQIFSIVSSSLHTSATFDYETKNSYSIRIRSTDQGGFFSEKVFVITVTNVNDAPVITQGTSTRVNMSKNGSPTKFALTLNAIDQDGDTITWSIPNPALHGTAKAAGTGVSKAIAYTPVTGYTGNDSFMVQVSDGKSGADTIVVDVAISSTPGIPILTTLTTQPRNGQLVSTLTPTFAWGAPTPAADHFRLQVSTSSSFKTMVINDSTISTTGYEPASLLEPGRRYYWRVQGVNAAGVAGGWAPTHYFLTPLSQPVLDKPGVDEELPTDRPEFSWQGVGGATQYTIQIASDNKFSKMVTNKTVSGAGYTLTSDLPQNKPLFWRIRAKTSYVSSAWSEIGSFTSGNPPSVPVLSKPANKAKTSDYTPLFDWSNSKVPGGVTFGHYQIQVSNNDPLFTTTVIDENVNEILNSTFTPTIDLASNSLFYWRVRSWSDAGDYSAWSSVYSLRTTIEPAVLSSLTATSLRPTFKWEEVKDAVSYTIQVSRYSSYKSLLINKSLAGLEYTPTSDLPRNTLLYWRVMTKGVYSTSSWSETGSFTNGNPPSVPVLSKPANKAITSNYKPLFDWSDSTVPSGVVLDHYQIQVSTDKLFSTTVIDEAVTGMANSSFSPATELASDRQFYWRVRAWGTWNGVLHNSSWTSVYSLRTTIEAPTLTSPIEGEVATSLKPTFEWADADVAGITTYTLQVSRNANFTSPLVNKTLKATSYTPATDLPAGGVTLYWRVRANGANGPSAWSNAGSFVTQ